MKGTVVHSMWKIGKEEEEKGRIHETPTSVEKGTKLMRGVNMLLKLSDHDLRAEENLEKLIWIKGCQSR